LIGGPTLACVFDASASALNTYVDGQLRSTLNVQLSTLSTNGTSGVSMGRNSPSGELFYGEIDGLRLWNVARPASLLSATRATCG